MMPLSEKFSGGYYDIDNFRASFMKSRLRLSNRKSTASLQIDTDDQLGRRCGAARSGFDFWCVSSRPKRPLVSLQALWYSPSVLRRLCTFWPRCGSYDAEERFSIGADVITGDPLLLVLAVQHCVAPVAFGAQHEIKRIGVGVDKHNGPSTLCHGHDRSTLHNRARMVLVPRESCCSLIDS
ncbi:MAG: hypothetical protein U5N55_11685 [Cypionkella sp.]|nr:hypothetical protein [Cypionkella sp.]